MAGKAKDMTSGSPMKLILGFETNGSRTAVP